MLKHVIFVSFCLFFASFSFAGDNGAFKEQLVLKIRDPKTGPAGFRKTLQQIGQLEAAEVLVALERKPVSVKTATGAVATHPVLAENPVLVTILRAGIPLLHGVQKVFPRAEVGFLGMARDEKTKQSSMDYVALPTIEGKDVILVDTMLATGGSLIQAIQLIEKQKPRRIYVIAAISSVVGVQKIQTYKSPLLRDSIQVFSAAVDPTLNDEAYIVPGLGDAGDRAYGKKAPIVR